MYERSDDLTKVGAALLYASLGAVVFTSVSIGCFTAVVSATNWALKRMVT